MDKLDFLDIFEALDTLYTNRNNDELIENTTIDSVKAVSYGISVNKFNGIKPGISNFLNTLITILSSESIRASFPDKSFDRQLAGYDTATPYLSTSSVLLSHIGSRRWPLGLILDKQKLLDANKAYDPKFVEIDSTYCTLAAEGRKSKSPISILALAEYENINNSDQHLYRLVCSGVSSSTGASVYVDEATFLAFYSLFQAWNKYAPSIKKPRGVNKNTDWSAAHQYTENPTAAAGTIPWVGGYLRDSSKPAKLVNTKDKFKCIASVGYAVKRLDRFICLNDIVDYADNIKRDTGVDLADLTVLRNVFADINESELRLVLNVSEALAGYNVSAANKEKLPAVSIKNSILAIVLPEKLHKTWKNIIQQLDKQVHSTNEVTADMIKLASVCKAKGLLDKIYFISDQSENTEKDLYKFSLNNASKNSKTDAGFLDEAAEVKPDSGILAIVLE